MTLRVLKYGGTSVETPTHILAVARQILHYRERGDRVIVVVSAMGQFTDELVHLAHRVSRTPPRRELDMLLTAGERISMSLLAMALGSLGCPAISFTGSQSGIVTDNRHADARVFSVRPFRIEEELEKGKVVIVAGFQGVSPEKEVTTLGRGGSDTTAVALAIAFGADEGEICTDVDGIWTGDPRVVPHAQRLETIDYDPMIALSHFGGRVLYRRAVRLARRFGLPLSIRSSLRPGAGTRVPKVLTTRVPFTEESCPMETNRILAIALESPVCRIRVTLPDAGSTSVADRVNAPDGTSLLFYGARNEAGERECCWILPTSAPIDTWLDPANWPEGSLPRVDRDLALVSLIGEGAHLQVETILRAEELLHEAGVKVESSQTGAHSLSFLIDEASGETASRLLHDHFIATLDPAT